MLPAPTEPLALGSHEAAIMSGTAKKTDPKLWDKVKKDVTKGDHGGKPGQWSARKAQMASAEYKKEGGGYEGGKSGDNHLQQWTDEQWGTKSGKKSGDTGERYLPKKAREKLTKEEYDRTSAKKRADGRKGKQFSAQPKDVARKTHTGAAGGGKAHPAGARDGQPSKAALYAQAKQKNFPGRSRMSRDELQKALA